MMKTLRFPFPKALFFLLVSLGLVVMIAILSPRIDLLKRLIHVQPNVKPADVIVVFSAGMLDDCDAHPNLLKREQRGAELLKSGYSRSGKLIYTGGYSNPSVSGISYAECRNMLAKRFDIPPDKLILDHAKDTLENAVHSKAIMDRNGWKSAVLVTSVSHLFRASKTFEKQGALIYPESVPDVPSLGSAWFDANRRALLHRFIYEYGALLKYKVYGYI